MSKQHMAPKYAKLGSIVSGTLVEADLIEAWTKALYALEPKASALHDAEDWLNKLARHKENPRRHDPRDDVEETREIMEDLEEALGDFAPPFCYFGAHPGDGADFGFWVSEDALGDGIQDQEIQKVSDLSKFALDIEKSGQYVLVVNDHGNMTLYWVHFEPHSNLTKFDEVWATV